jgi:hypothetical protein
MTFPGQMERPAPWAKDLPHMKRTRWCHGCMVSEITTADTPCWSGQGPLSVIHPDAR